MSKTLGMDFGTTNSGAAFHDGNQVHMIDLGSGRLQMPSVVALPPGTDPLLGRAALRYLEREKDPQFVYRSIKRKLGQRYIEGEDDGFQIVPDKEGFQAFSGPDESTLAPEALAALIMARLRRAAEEQTGETFTSVMVGVPYAAGPDQIAMTRLAASMAASRRCRSAPSLKPLAMPMNWIVSASSTARLFMTRGVERQTSRSSTARMGTSNAKPGRATHIWAALSGISRSLTWCRNAIATAPAGTSARPGR